VKKEKRYGENENITEKMTGSISKRNPSNNIFNNNKKENFVLDLRKDNPSNFAIIYRYHRKDNKDISRIKK